MEGERDRFERELLPLMDDAYTLARYLMRDAHDAQDVVQDAYLRALRYFDSYRDGNARAWFLTIVRHCCYTRRRQRRAGDDAPLGDDVAAPASYAADRRTLDGDRRETLTRTLDALSPEFREALVLRDVHGLSYREIARIVGVPLGTVMSRLARARQRAQRALGLHSREAS